MKDSLLIAVLAVVGGLLAGVELARSRLQSLLAWGLLAVAAAVFLAHVA